MIIYLLRTRPKELRTLAALNDLVNAETHTLTETFKSMAQRPEAVIATKARMALAALEHDEFRSVMNNAGKALNLFAEDRIAARLTATSDFDLMDVHRSVMSVYVMVPEEMMATFAPFLRIVIGCALAAMVRGKALTRPKHKPLLMIDECQNLGRLDALERAMGVLREYARMVLVFQDLGRMRKLYGEDGAVTFIANSGAQVAFGVNDIRAARDLAEMLGMGTVASRSQGQSQANTDLLKYQEQTGHSEAGRYLLDPSEILRLPARKSIVRMNTVRAPILAQKVRYFREARWRGLWDRWRENDAGPFHAGEPVAASFGTRDGAQAAPPAGPTDLATRHQFDQSGRLPGADVV
jgi:type IV secretion system protein VirD4